MLMVSFVVFCLCGGVFLHPPSLPPFRGYDDASVPFFKEWNRLKIFVPLTDNELRCLKEISWREDRWRNRKHKNPKVGGLFGQKGCSSACPLEQARWAKRYALSRYGSLRKALLHHRKRGWW
jgi:hypothetical protein